MSSRDTNNSSCNGGVCRILKDENNLDKPYCIPNNLTSLGNIYCGNLYNGHHKNCNIQSPTNCGVGCEKYQDPRVHNLPPGTSAQNKGICVSDGKETYDLTTGEN